MEMNARRILFILLAIFIPLAILIIVMCAISIKKLDSKDAGLKYDNVAKILADNTTYEGLHNGPPGFYFIIFPSVFESMNFGEVTCLDKDGVKIVVDVSFQFKANTLYLKKLVEQFVDYDTYKKMMNTTGLSSIHDACANYTTLQFQTQRGGFQELIRENMKNSCEILMCEINDFQVNDIQRPQEYEQAVKDKESAKEDINIALNERPRLLIQAQAEYEKSLKEAEIIVNEAYSKVSIRNNEALKEGETLAFQYAKDLEIYQNVKVSQGLSNEGLINYMGVRAVANAKHDVNLGFTSPAKTFYDT